MFGLIPKLSSRARISSAFCFRKGVSVDNVSKTLVAVLLAVSKMLQLGIGEAGAYICC